MSPVDYELALMLADDGSRPDGTDWLDRITGGEWTASQDRPVSNRWLWIGMAKCLGAWLLLCATFALVFVVAERAHALVSQAPPPAAVRPEPAADTTPT